MNEKPKRFYWKGKKVSQKEYYNRCRQQQVEKTIRSVFNSKTMYNLKTDGNVTIVEGRRIVHVEGAHEENKFIGLLNLLGKIKMAMSG